MEMLLLVIYLPTAIVHLFLKFANRFFTNIRCKRKDFMLKYKKGCDNMKIYKNVWELVGNTPLLSLLNICETEDTDI